MKRDQTRSAGLDLDVAALREVDDRAIGAGSRGPVTKTLQTTFFDAVRGRDRKYESWLSYV